MVASLRRQAQQQADLRYAPEEDALLTLLTSAGKTLRTTRQSQRGAARGISAGVDRALPKLDDVFTSAGLTPEVRAQAASNPAARRVAETLANAQVEMYQRKVQAQEGAAYAVNKALADYRDTVDQIQGRVSTIGREKGMFEAATLGDLVSSDRVSRRSASSHRADRQASSLQAELDRANSRGNALIGAGVDPNTGQPLPARPKAPGKSDAPRATPAAQQKVAAQVGEAVSHVRDLRKAGRSRPEIGKILLQGRKEQKITDDNGQVLTVPGRPKLPQLSVTAALDLVFNKGFSGATVQKFHAQGYRVDQLGQNIGPSSMRAKPRVPKKPKPGRFGGTLTG